MKCRLFQCIGMLIMAVSACSPQTPAAVIPAEPPTSPVTLPEPTATEQARPKGQAFTSERFDYSFEYPAGWIIKDRPGEWAVYDPLDAVRTNGIDSFAGYVDGRNLALGIGARSLADGETLESWVETAKAQIQAGVTRGMCYTNTKNKKEPVSEEAFTLGSEPAVRLEYVCPDPNDSYGLIALSVRDNKGYWITWISPQGNAEMDKAEFAQILNTLSFAE